MLFFLGNGFPVALLRFALTGEELFFDIRWVLGESGKIEVLEPPELRAKVAAAGKRIWERNQGDPADA